MQREPGPWSKRLSSFLIFAILLEILAPAAWALPDPDSPRIPTRPNYPLARKAGKARVKRPLDSALQQILSKAAGPAANLPGIDGQAPLDRAGQDVEHPHAGATPDANATTSSSTSSTPTASSEPSTDSEQTSTSQARTTTAEEDCGCDNEHEGAGGELGIVNADPNQPFPQWEFSRQTVQDGPYLRTGQQLPTGQVQDYLLHVAQKLEDPGASEDYTVDFVSPIADNNQTSRDSQVSCRWSYRRLGGTTASGFDAKYELEIRVWDEKNPDSGRVVFRKRENMWLQQVPMHAGFALRDVGQYRMLSTRNDEQPKTQLVQINYSTPDEEGLNRRLSDQERSIESPYIAYTSDERVGDRKTYELPEPDQDGHQNFTARIDLRKSGYSKTKFHSFASAQVHYTSDGNNYRVERRIYDSLFPEGHTASVTTGDGRLDHIDVTGGAGLPRSGTWQVKEVADGQSDHTSSVQVRSVETEVAPYSSSLSLFQDNGGTLYRMAVKSGSNWIPQNFRWTLTLRNTKTDEIVRTYTGDVSDNSETNREFYQVWDGQDAEGNRVTNGTSIAPELSIAVLNQASSSNLRANRSSLAAASSDTEEWVLNGGGVDFRIDDDLELRVNGVTVFKDASGFADYFTEIPFQAKVGDTLEVLATDTFGICSEVDPLYIRRTSTGTNLKLTKGYDGPCDDSAHGITFFDETYILTDDEKTVEAVFRSNGASLDNETRNACEALAWTRTSSKPPPPPKAVASSSNGGGILGRPVIDHTFDIPGMYTPANYPGASAIASDIDAMFNRFINSRGQTGFFMSPIPIEVKRGSGRYSHNFGDLVVYSRTAPLYLGRSHSSDQQARPGHYGWNWSFDEKLIVFQNQAIYQLPDGGVVTYQDDGDGYKPAMNHITTKLTRLDDRTFRFDYKGGGSSTFKIPSGLDPASEKPVWAVLQKTTDTHGFSNTFQWDAKGLRLQKMQGPDPSQFIKLQWANCDTPQLVSACDSHGRNVCYDYATYKGPGGVRDDLLSGVTSTGNRKIQFRYHPVLGQRRYELLDVLHNEVLQEKVVANPASPGQLAEVTHRPDKTLTYTRQVNQDTGEVTSVLTKKSASNNSPGGQTQSLTCQLDGKDRIIRISDDLGHETRCEWDDFYNMVRVYDQQGRDLHMTYDDRRNLLSVTDQAGRVSRTEWDAQDNPVATVDPLGRRSTATFDAQRNPLTMSDPLGHTTRMNWDGTGLLQSVVDNLGNQVSMSYDGKGFLKSIQMPATAQNGPASTSVERNAADEVVRSFDPLGRVHKVKRDAIGRVVEAIAPAVEARFRQECLPPAQAKMKFNRNDQVESVTAVDGRVTQYGYDSAERLVEVQETGYPAPTRLVYDSFDNLITLTRPNGAVTRYEYDRINRVRKVTYPGGDEETLTYDARGRVSQWRAGSRLVIYEYDSVDRLVHMSCPSTGDDYHYNYDDANRLLSMQDQTGTTSYDYTQNDRLQRVTHPGNRSLTYGYDAGDRLISTLDPENVVTAYSYNQRNELVQATHDGQVMNYGYDLLGRATEIQYPNGVRGTQVFDERDRLLYRAYRKDATPLVTLKYAYNQLGQRILDDRTMPNGNQLASFRYNQRLELTRSERSRGCNPPEVHSYAYDLNHNITKKDGVSYTNNLADQLLSVAGAGTLTYNDSGAATNVQGWDVTYNCADQITGIQAPGKNIAYQYDAGGQRVSKTVNGVTQNFLWNGGNIAKEYTSTGAVRADYFLGAGREGIKTNGQWYYYLSDIQGSTLMLTNASGQSAATYDYSDYGETRQTSGSTALYNPFLYTGQEYDFETNLYHLRARHYSPSLGRFFSRDPIGYAGGSNMMGYCAGDPVNQIDPSGTEKITLYSQAQRMFDIQLIAEGKPSTTATFNVSLVWDTDAETVSLAISNIRNIALTGLKFSGAVTIEATKGGLKSRLPKGGDFLIEAPAARSELIVPLSASKEWSIGSICNFTFKLEISAQHNPLAYMAPNGIMGLRTFRALPIFAQGRSTDRL